ncbi:hypothetical protein HPB47_028440 [Ixodes persulcatus]|uniref:Uncharacterized protein n=1 Tax=Ixodes persulcatus TaxID=34615 RepID=A0AC60PT62_IXOPE|nr:hypothetical protein HPB47_028440 [Ixodes persulcatus]
MYPSQVRTMKDTTSPRAILDLVLLRTRPLTTEVIRWGIEKEPEAKEAYQKFMETRHSDFRLCSVGFVIDKKFHPYLRGRVFRSLDELAQAAHQIQADILAELRYRPPPPPEACLEPSCAWTGTTRESMDEHGSRPVLPGRVPRALDPYTHGLGDGAQVRERGRQYQAPSRERYPSATSAPLRCFRCGSLGHFRRDCTRRVSNDNSGNEALGHPTVSVLQQSRPSLTSSPAGSLL